MMWGKVTAEESKQGVVQESKQGVKLNVEVSNVGDHLGNHLGDGIKALYEEFALFDVMLVAGGQSFPAHKAALATFPALRDRLYKAMSDASEAAAAAEAKAAEAAAAAEAQAAAAAATPAAAPAAAPEAAATNTASAENPAPCPPAQDQPAGDAKPDSPEVTPAAQPEVTASPPAEAADPAVASSAPAEASEAQTAQCDTAAPKLLELHFPDISSPEAIRILLAHIYGTDNHQLANYLPSNDEINKDLLRLASSLQIPSLLEFATHWLAMNLHSSNAVSRLSTCQEFKLNELFEAASEALAADAFALSQIADDMEVLKHPRLLQKLLIRVAALHPANPAQGKRARSEERQREPKRSKVGGA